MQSYFRYFIFSFAVLFCSNLFSFAQKARIGLAEVIELAKQRAIGSKLATTRQLIGTYEYQSFLGELKPQISLSGNFPGYVKEFANVIQPDGTVKFEPIRQSLTNLSLGFTQKLPFTGGQISINSDLSRFRDATSKVTRFNGTPMYVQLNQPIFGYNALRWRQRIEPLKLKEAELTYSKDMNTLALDVTKIYFDVLMAQSDVAISSFNLSNVEFNYAIEKKRMLLGTTSEDKLLNLELQVLNSRKSLQQSKFQYDISLFYLRNLLAVESLDNQLEIPNDLPEIKLKLEDAIDLAHKNRPEFIAFERKRLEAAGQVAQAKSARHQVELIASYGLNRAASNLGAVFSDPLSQQMFNLGFNFPLIDWGRRKAAINTSEALQQLVDYTNSIDRINFDQEVVTMYRNLTLLRGNVELSLITDSVALRRFELSNKLYQSGKLSITDLNISQHEKDEARKTYILALRNFWEAWYNFKRITGWIEK